jgi:hypothetical protein
MTTDDRILLQAKRFIFPLLLIPYKRGSFTRGMIGFRDGSPVFVKDIKASQSQCRLTLSSRGLICIKLFPRWLLIDIPAASIRSVRAHPHLPDLMEIRFDQAKKGRMLRFLTSGTPGAVPEGVVYFNLGKEAPRWIEEVRQVASGRPSELTYQS